MSTNQQLNHETATSPRKLWLWIAGILFITIVCYKPIFSDSKEFTNWDDPGYVTEQPLVTSIDLKQIFAPSAVVVYNYHPITVLSLAIDYQRGFDEDTNTISIAPFVRTNMVLHLINTALVFLFIYRLCKARTLLPAGIAALIFGIHPLHVESVAWISERKDLLYCFFFLLSCLTYLRYLDTKRLTWLCFSLLLFLASCLSKAMAVPLPFVLLLMDYWYHRRFSIPLLLEKIPYLSIAVVIGLHTLTVQQGAIGDFANYTIIQRLLFAAAAFCNYLIKWLVPINLSAFYPYPDIGSNGSLTTFYYIAVLLAMTIIVVPILLLRNAPEKRRALIYGISFFILMVLLVLPVITVGGAIMADRYTYVSSIGLVFLVPGILGSVFEHVKWRNIAIGISSMFIVFYAVETYQRVQVWENSQTLWTDVIDQYPMHNAGGMIKNAGVKVAYKNLGDYYASAKMYDSAFVCYNVLTATGTKDAEVWSNLGDIYVIRKDYPKALDALGRSVTLDSMNHETYLKRAIVFANSNNYPEAIHNLDKVIQLKPDDQQAKSMREKMRAFLK